MKNAVALVAIIVAMRGDAVPAQSDRTIERLNACSRAEAMERLKCVNELMGGLTEAVDRGPPDGPGWVVSETTSPVDYRQQIVASITARSSTADAPSALTALCRAQRTELVVSVARTSSPIATDETRVSYWINEGAPIEQNWRAIDTGHGLLYAGDAMRLLRLMPDGGQFHIKVRTGSHPPQESLFDLAGVDLVRRRIAAACNWPQL